jgi:hypothetical protein
MYFYLPSSERDSDDFERANPSVGCSWDDPASGEIDVMIRDSWQRIFDLDWCDDYVTHPPEEKQIQATYWELSLASVIAVDRFTAR